MSLDPLRGEAALPYPFPRANCLSPMPHLDLLDRREMALVTMPSGDPARLAVRHADVVRVLTDRRLSRRAMLAAPGGPRMTRADLDEPSLLGLDPPDHTRVRRLCAPALRPSAVAELRVPVLGRVLRLLDGVGATAGATDPVDLHRAFSLPLATGVLCDLLGVPDDRRAPLLEWSRQKLALTSLPPDRARAGHEALRAHWSSLLFDGPVPGSGLLPGGGLLRTLLDGHRSGLVSRPEVLATAVNLFVAGHVTTAATLTNGLLHLLVHRGQWRALCREPSLVDRAVHEILRYDTIADVGLPRLATADLVIGSTPVRAGQAVIPSHAHADRDPRVFDSPDTFDITRAPGPHLAFGHGPHHCIGSHLALLELRTALKVLAHRCPGLVLAEPAAGLRLLHGSLIGGVARLPTRCRGGGGA
ncbi:cytochrome P450 [Streptomyces tsukubensis]|uniref:cytochrome P450 n=1 Tax=Streptomyces tsukubensis TaxID=83656 RepID=UPI00344FA12E